LNRAFATSATDSRDLLLRVPQRRRRHVLPGARPVPLNRELLRRLILTDRQRRISHRGQPHRQARDGELPLMPHLLDRIHLPADAVGDLAALRHHRNVTRGLQIDAQRQTECPFRCVMRPKALPDRSKSTCDEYSHS
jgi:hypothetical protein